jgi:hypothetical protein
MASLIPDDLEEPTTVVEYGVVTQSGEVASGFGEDADLTAVLAGRDDLIIVRREVTVTPWRTVPRAQTEATPADPL